MRYLVFFYKKETLCLSFPVAEAAPDFLSGGAFTCFGHFVYLGSYKWDLFFSPPPLAMPEAWLSSQARDGP